MKDAQVEYLGFSTEGASRQYTLRVKDVSGEFRDFTLAIPIEAFLTGRVRFQDAPEICFLKLQRALAASPEQMPSAKLPVTNAELEEYRNAHAPRPVQRRVLGR